MTTNAELMGQTLTDIADAIRVKRGISNDIAMMDMAQEILNIETDHSQIYIDMPSDFFSAQTLIAPDVSIEVPQS